MPTEVDTYRILEQLRRDLMDHAMPVVEKHGLVVRQNTVEKRIGKRMQVVITITEGESP